MHSIAFYGAYFEYRLERSSLLNNDAYQHYPVILNIAWQFH